MEGTSKRKEARMNSMARWLMAGVVLVAGLTLPMASRAQDGAGVYKAKCAMCHGPDGGGSTAAGKATKARDLCSDEVKKETDDEWTDIISKGKNKMPSYDKKLSADEIKAVIAYMRGLCKK